MARKAIKDEFTDLPISRQRKYQLRMEKSGRCTECGEPAVSGGRCVQHLVLARERQRKLKGWKRRYHNTLGYRLQEQKRPEKSSTQEPPSGGIKKARVEIHDEFTDLPISPQRRYQLRMMRDGRCAECGEPVIYGSRCLNHLMKARERMRKKRESKKRHLNTLAYQQKKNPEGVKQMAEAIRKLQKKHRPK